MRAARTFRQFKTATRPAIAQKTGALWFPLVLMLYSTFGLFYAATIFDSQIAALLNAGKWGALSILLVASVFALARTPSEERLPVTALAPLTIVFCGFVSAILSDIFLTSAATLLSLCLMFGVAVCLSASLGTVERQAQFLQIVANVGRVVIASSALFYVLGLNLGRTTTRFSGWVDNPNTLAILLMPALIILLAQAQERLRGRLTSVGFFAVLGLFLLIQTGSRASFVWLGVSLLAFQFVRMGFGLSTLLGLAGIVFLAAYWETVESILFQSLQRQGTTGDILSGRSEMWPLGLSFFEERPVFGHGLGSSGGLITSHGWVFVESQGAHFHNSYLTVLVETGGLGLAVLVLILIRATIASILKGEVHRLARARANIMPSVPFVIFIGALGHAFFETWLLSAGNSNTLLFWTCVFLAHTMQRPSSGSPRIPPRVSPREYPAASPRHEGPDQLR